MGLSQAIDEFFYCKPCIGLRGRPFYAYKIRTISKGASGTTSMAHSDYDQFGKPKNDSRVTDIGRFLRRYWIDELPQIYNVLKGEMKWVGIRPMMEADWKRYPEDIRQKSLECTPGLMGAQYAFDTKGGFDVHLENMRKYLREREKNPNADLEYFIRILYSILFRGVRSS